MKKCGLKRAYAQGGVLPDQMQNIGSDNPINAEREARWRMDEVESKMKYAADPNQQKALGGLWNSMNKDYTAKFAGDRTLPPPPGAVAARQEEASVFGAFNKTMGFRQGGTVGVDQRGFIEGPGGVDNVPARVDETGEEIRVGAGERIVNKKQNAALEALAAQAGMSLDEYLEASTQEPVGPTMKNGLRAAQSGGRFDDLSDQAKHAFRNTAQAVSDAGRNIQSARDAGSYASAVGQAVRAPLAVGSGLMRDVNNSAAFALRPVVDTAYTVATGHNVAPAVPAATRAASKAAPTPFDQLPQSDPSYDRKEFRSAAGNVAARQELDNPNVAGLRAAGVTGGVLGDVAVGGRTPATGIRTIDTQNGKVYAGRDAKGQLVVNSNVNPGGLAAADAARDKEFAAKGYAKDGYGNWMTPQRIADKQALAQIQSDRAKFNAFSDQVNDPRARAAGLRQVMFDTKQQELGNARDAAMAKAKLDAAKFDQDERRLRMDATKADREFGSKQMEANTKDIDAWMDTMAPTAGLKDEALAAAQHKRGVLQQVMGNHWGGNVPQDRQAFLKAQPQMAREAQATMRLYDVLGQQGFWDKWVRNNGTSPARTMQALSPKRYDQDSDMLTLADGYKVKGKEIWGNDADMRAAITGRIK